MEWCTRYASFLPLFRFFIIPITDNSNVFVVDIQSDLCGMVNPKKNTGKFEMCKRIHIEMHVCMYAWVIHLPQWTISVEKAYRFAEVFYSNKKILHRVVLKHIQQTVVTELTPTTSVIKQGTLQLHLRLVGWWQQQYDA